MYAYAAPSGDKAHNRISRHRPTAVCHTNQHIFLALYNYAMRRRPGILVGSVRCLFGLFQKLRLAFLLMLFLAFLDQALQYLIGRYTAASYRGI